MNATPDLQIVDRTPLRHDYHTTLKVHCGCGFRAATVAEGEQHARSTGHTCHITGEIRASY